jgi:hypothetical protein
MNEGCGLAIVGMLGVCFSVLFGGLLIFLGWNFLLIPLITVAVTEIGFGVATLLALIVRLLVLFLFGK